VSPSVTPTTGPVKVSADADPAGLHGADHVSVSNADPIRTSRANLVRRTSAGPGRPSRAAPGRRSRVRLVRARRAAKATADVRPRRMPPARARESVVDSATRATPAARR
jgi:hypothetical protein